MPLSDHEQRLLEQMERALYQEDPKFASSLRHGRSGSIDRKRILIGLAGALAGLLIVLVGVATSLPIVGVVGFAAMVAGAFWAWSGSRREAAGPQAAAETAEGAPSAPQRNVPQAKGQSAFMNKMEQRWRKRREGDQRS